MLLKLEFFQYATSLYLNMGYYHIRLRKNTSNLCTIIIIWGKYCYKRLPMRFDNSSAIFQQKWMIYFMDSNLSMRTYINFWSQQKETVQIMYRS